MYSHTRSSSFFLGKVTALGVLCCFALFVCLNLLASFFLPSHLSLNMYIHVHVYILTHRANKKNKWKKHYQMEQQVKHH